MDISNFIQEKENIFVHKSLYENRPLSAIKIWRYMDVCKLISLHRGILYFANRKKMSDKREPGLWVYQHGRERFHNPFTELRIVGENADKTERPEKQEAFVSSWSKSAYEDFTLWSTYTKDTLGVAIQSNLQRLVDSIKEVPEETIYIADVKYKERLPKTDNNNNLTFLKYAAYEGEKELRLAIFSPNSKDKLLEVAPDILIESIYISPLLEIWQQEEMFNLLEELFSKSSSGINYSSIVEKSICIGHRK